MMDPFKARPTAPKVIKTENLEYGTTIWRAEFEENEGAIEVWARCGGNMLLIGLGVGESEARRDAVETLRRWAALLDGQIAYAGSPLWTRDPNDETEIGGLDGAWCARDTPAKFAGAPDGEKYPMLFVVSGPDRDGEISLLAARDCYMNVATAADLAHELLARVKLYPGSKRLTNVESPKGGHMDREKLDGQLQTLRGLRDTIASLPEAGAQMGYSPVAATLAGCIEGVAGVLTTMVEDAIRFQDALGALHPSASGHAEAVEKMLRPGEPDPRD